MLCTLNHAKLTVLHPTLKMETSSSFCLSPKPKGWQDDSHTWHRGMQSFLVAHLLMWLENILDGSKHPSGLWGGYRGDGLWSGLGSWPSLPFCLSHVFTRDHREGKGTWKWNSQRALRGEMWQTPAEGTKPPEELGKWERQEQDVNCHGKSEWIRLGQSDPQTRYSPGTNSLKCIHFSTVCYKNGYIQAARGPRWVGKEGVGVWDFSCEPCSYVWSDLIVEGLLRPPHLLLPDPWGWLGCNGTLAGTVRCLCGRAGSAPTTERLL